MTATTVTAPCVQVKLIVDGKPVMRLAYQGAVLPDTVDPDNLARLVAKGMVSVDKPAKGKGKDADPPAE